MTAGLATGLAVVVSACGTGSPTAAKVSSTTEPPSTSTTTSVAPATSAPPASTVPSSSVPDLPTSGPPEDLPVTTADLDGFEEAFSVYNGIPVSDIAGVVSGSTHEAYEPSTRTYWATARFNPSASAGQNVADFQDGGDIGIFTRSPSATWAMSRPGGEPFPCPGDFPADVQTLWGLTSSPYCSSGGTPSQSSTTSGG